MEQPSPWKLGGLTGKEFLARVWAGFNDDDLLGRAGQIAYSLLFAIFPFLIFLTSVLGTMAAPGSRIRAGLVGALTSSMPGSASDLVRNVITETSSASGGGKLSFGLIVALLSASSGVAAIMDTLNAAYAVREGRSFLKLRSTALGLTVILGILIVLSTAVVLYGNTIVNFVADQVGLGGLATMTWKIVQWPIAICFLLLAYSLIYYYGPDVQFRRWHWITPGSVAGVVLSLVVSFGFRLYIQYFGSFSKTYGSLGAVMILLLWFYVMGLAVLIGGEANSEIENAAANRGAPHAKRKGEKVPSGSEKAA